LDKIFSNILANKTEEEISGGSDEDETEPRELFKKYKQWVKENPELKRVLQSDE